MKDYAQVSSTSSNNGSEVKVEDRTFVILYSALSWELTSKAPRMVRVKGVIQFYLPPAHFIHGWNAPFCLFSGRELTFTFAICYRPSVCLLSVVCRLSVCDVGAPYSGGWTFRQFFSPYDSPGTLLFWCQKSLVGTPISPWNLRSKWPTPFKTA